jgi:hypothetical protein
MFGRRLGATLVAAGVLLSVAAPVRSDDASVPSGTWEGRMSIAWSVRFDAAAGGGFVYYSGSGPMLFESVAGDIQGEFQYQANGLVVPGPGSPFPDRVAGAAITAQGKLRSGDGAIALRDVTGAVSVAGTTVAFGPSTGTLTIDRVGCVVVSGRMLFPPEGIGAIDAVGTFQEIEAYWAAAVTGDVGVDEEALIIDRLTADLLRLADVVRLDGGGLDRALITARVVEAEQRIAGLSAEATCGISWASPLWGALAALLEAVLENPDGTSASDLEFLVSTAVRSGTLPTTDGSLEARLAATLGTKLDAAIAANDRASIDAVFMAAVALGERALGERALAALGAGS